MLHAVLAVKSTEDKVLEKKIVFNFSRPNIIYPSSNYSLFLWFYFKTNNLTYSFIRLTFQRFSLHQGHVVLSRYIVLLSSNVGRRVRIVSCYAAPLEWRTSFSNVIYYETVIDLFIAIQYYQYHDCSASCNSPYYVRKQ